MVKSSSVACEISLFSRVRVKRCGNITEVMARGSNVIPKCPVVKLNEDEYIDLRNGEIKLFRHTENRAENIITLSRTLADLRDLINCNVTEPEKCRWLTLTYAENMTDTKRLYTDVQVFIKDMRRKYGHFEYIICVEPQGRGAWHMHCVFIWRENAPFLKNNEVAHIWKRGFVSVKAMQNCDNLGAYLSAYLGNAEITEDSFPGEVRESVVCENGKKVKKKFVKGARLHMYPAKMQIYRYSKGVKKPVVEYMTYGDIKKEQVGCKTYSKSVEISVEDGSFNEVINYEYYNSKRKENQ